MPFVIYTKDNCIYCVKAKNILDENHLEYIVHNNKDVSSLKQKHKHYTFPFIFKDNKFLGGYVQLEEYLTLVKNKEEF